MENAVITALVKWHGKQRWYPPLVSPIRSFEF